MTGPPSDRSAPSGALAATVGRITGGCSRWSGTERSTTVSASCGVWAGMLGCWGGVSTGALACWGGSTGALARWVAWWVAW